VGADQESIRVGPSKLQRSTGDSFMTENIWGTGRIELDEDGESGQDNMFKAHLDQNETTQSALLNPIPSPDQNSGTPHSLWSVLFGTQVQSKNLLFCICFFSIKVCYGEISSRICAIAARRRSKFPNQEIPQEH
jgi:hypothetical protein